MVSNKLKLIEAHYEKCWGTESDKTTWNHGPTGQLPPGFRVLVFAPNERHKMWTYATCGMSQQNDATALELHLFSPIKIESHVELLTVIAHYHVTGDYLDVGHTVNFGRPWLPESICDHGLISLPYLDGPRLEWLEGPLQKIHFLWLIPVSASEVEYKKKHGLEALEYQFEKNKIDYLSSKRASVA